MGEVGDTGQLALLLRGADKEEESGLTVFDAADDRACTDDRLTETNTAWSIRRMKEQRLRQWWEAAEEEEEAVVVAVAVGDRK